MQKNYKKLVNNKNSIIERKKFENINIKLTPAQITGNTDGTGILLNCTFGYDYENGKYTDTQSHIKCVVMFSDNGFEKVLIKVPGTKSVVTAEQLAQQSGKIRVRFKDTSGKFYRTNRGEYALSCSADGVEVVS